MSGPELILGAVPLLISSLEHYKKCFEVLGCWRRFQLEHKKCKDRVQLFSVHYDLALTLLFADDMEDADELIALKEDPKEYKAQWQVLEIKLKDRLMPRVYKTYLATTENLMAEVEKLKVSLGYYSPALQERLFAANQLAPAVSQRDTVWHRVQERSTYEARRLRFSQGRNERERLFSEIERLVKSLEELVEKNDKANRRVSNRAQSSTQVPQSLVGFWTHARDMFVVLSRSIKCSCPAEHCVELLLAHRVSRVVQLDLVFRFSAAYSCPADQPWSCHRAMMAEVSKPGLANVSPAATRSAIKTFNSSIVSALRGPKKPGIAHAVTASASSVNFAFAVPVTSTSERNQSIHDPAHPETITDLCETIRKHTASAPCAGLLACDHVNAEYAISSPARVQPASHQWSSATLDDLMSDSAKMPNRSQRYRIAIAVASSHLQLHSSAWLGRRWCSQDISFEVENGVPDFGKPRLRKLLKSPPHAQSPGRSADETFASLGILLLELCDGKVLEKSPFREQYRSPSGQADFHMDRAAAGRWAETVEGNAGPDYAGAVYWCLGQMWTDAKDQSWRQEFFRKVVEPLQASYEPLRSSSEKLLADADYY